MSTASETLACSACTQQLDPTDSFCRHCGRRRGAKTRLYHQRWFVLVSLFLVVGPFALPLLWRSPRFSRSQKIVITGLQLVFVWLLLSGIVRAYTMYLEHISKLFG